MKKGFERLLFTPWIANLIYWIGNVIFVLLAFCVSDGIHLGFVDLSGGWALAVIVILLIWNRIWYEWTVAIFAIAENTRQCAVRMEAFDPKDIGVAMGKMGASLSTIRKDQVTKTEMEAVAKLLAGIREDILAQQIQALNGDAKAGCICPYCGAEILLPGWIQDGRRVACVSCGKKFVYASGESK